MALLRRVVEAGVTFIDTADAYGPNTNEVLIHDAFHLYPAGLVIAANRGERSVSNPTSRAQSCLGARVPLPPLRTRSCS
jgi:aryl-alcohol dehydrogenase-like predicted oxidoreductase